MKTIAMYLPQFHRVPENDVWWGDGFTEWVAVKEAEPLFEGHVQPKRPLNGNYYNLMEKSTLEQQNKWMKQYGIDGMCFYHYYFKDGRKILEKPTENLLKWKDIDMPFCFCWANESWVRNWSNLGGQNNTWTEKFRNIENPDGKGILLWQKYGRESEWQKHFEYLLPFFKDERYIKIEGKIVFLIYVPQAIYCLYEMTEFWRKLARENGIRDFFFIGANTAVKMRGLDAVLFNAPDPYWNPEVRGRTIRARQEQGGVRRYQYKEIWDNILRAESVKGIKTYFGGFSNYDNSPRRGKGGIVMEGFTIEMFKNNLCQLIKKNYLVGNETTFINAWNEWGEGSYLEPDEEYGFQYLEAVRDAKRKAENEIASGSVIIETDSYKTNSVSEDEQQISVAHKIRLIANCLDTWMSLKEEGISLAEYFERYHYDTVAMYGMGILGRHLLYDLEQSNVKVAYIIDRRSELKYPGIEVKNMKDTLEKVDAVIVTAVADFDEIYDMLREKMGCPILSISEIINEI